MPATAIIGYPPGTMGPEETGAQTAELYAAGWRRFKAPTGGAAERSAARLRAARAAAPDAWLGMDAAWVYDDVDAAADFVELHPGRAGWAGSRTSSRPAMPASCARLRSRIDMPIAQGDEQGGIYYPEALILAEAVDVVRVDLTCMGGITRGRRVIDQALDAGLTFAPHMFPHVHSQVLSAWGFTDVPIEWGIPFTGRPPHGRPAAAAGAHRGRPHGAAARGARLRVTSSMPTGSAASHTTTRTASSMASDRSHRRASGAGGWRTSRRATILRHPGGRTIDEAEHVWLAWVTHNVSDLHGDAHAARRTGWGGPVVLGMLTAAIVIGLAEPAVPPPDLAGLGLSRGWRSIRLRGRGPPWGHAARRVGDHGCAGTAGRCQRPRPSHDPWLRPARHRRGHHRGGPRGAATTKHSWIGPRRDPP